MHKSSLANNQYSVLSSVPLYLAQCANSGGRSIECNGDMPAAAAAARGVRTLGVACGIITFVTGSCVVTTDSRQHYVVHLAVSSGSSLRPVSITRQHGMFRLE